MIRSPQQYMIIFQFAPVVAGEIFLNEGALIECVCVLRDTVLCHITKKQFITVTKLLAVLKPYQTIN